MNVSEIEKSDSFKLKVLFVEDEEVWNKVLREDQVFSSCDNLSIKFCKTLDDAEKEIKDEFFHLTFVDLNLGGSTKLPGGYIFLRKICDERRSCRRILFSQHIGGKNDLGQPEIIAQLFEPSNLIVHGLINKTSVNTTAKSVITECLKRWNQCRLEIEGFEGVYSLISKKVRANSYGAKNSRDELYYLFLSLIHGEGFLFSSSTDWGRLKTTSMIESIGLELLDQGRSRSVVVGVVPRLKSGKIGNRMVAKIGPIHEIESENNNFSAYVKYFLSLNRRVENLAYSKSDVIGGLLYSFAGGAPQNIVPLGKILGERGKRSIVIKVIGEFFDESKKEWYDVTSEGYGLKKYFSDIHGLDNNRLGRELDNAFDALSKEINALPDGRWNNKCRSKFINSSPSEILGKPMFQSVYPECIVHGDLNSDNIIIDSDAGNKHILIDYRYTGYGPVSQDFSALEVSWRIKTLISPIKLARVFESESLILEDLIKIQKKYSQSQGDPTLLSSFGNDRFAGRIPDGHLFSRFLFGKYLLNFGKTNGADLKLYLLTSFLLSSKVFLIKSLDKDIKKRLFLWICVISKCLNK